MKYESTILKRLIDTYGVVGNPRYISEIIKEFIVRGKECFPNLFTYQADWLAHIDEFGLNPTYTVSYTGQSIYAPNTLERPVKSAILKGSTKYRDIDTGEVLDAFEDGRNLELVSVKTPVLTTTGKNLLSKESLRGYHQNVKEIDGWLIADEGDFGGNIISKALIEKGKTYTLSARIKSFNGGSAHYCFSHHGRDDFSYLGGNTDFNGSVVFTATETTYIDVWLLRQMQTGSVHYSDIQLEEGSVATSYEPFKSNILTVSEDVTLRGIGEVRDELNLLTGEVTERIGEIVLDDKLHYEHAWDGERDTETDYVIGVKVNNHLWNVSHETGHWLFKCDKLRTRGITSFAELKCGYFLFTVNKTILGDNLTDKKVREYVLSLNATVQYPLATESVKTVDLNILDQNGQNVKQLMSFNGGTHFNTSSLEGSPLPVVSVSVETDLEEILMMCSLEGNTM